MNTRTTTLPLTTQTPRPGAAARAMLRLLRGLRVGRLELVGPDGSRQAFGPGGDAAASASIRLADWGLLGELLRDGDIGLAEAYVEGRWSSPDPVALLRLALANRDVLERALHGSWWRLLLSRLRHKLNRNTRRGSRRNIEAHYDLGNAFYRLWLDPTMNYSSAWFDGDTTQPLAQAQHAKVQRTLDEVRLQPGQRLLEIGCGWGAVAEAAARRGAEVTGVTLSSEQLGYGRERLQAAGLAERAQLRLMDYRDLAGEPYDAIVSIEMFEAVGREYWRDYFATLRRQLKPGGLACVQTITIRDDLFEHYLHSTDFIQQYIFPGGLLPSPSAFRAEAARAGLSVESELAFGQDYALTLQRWRERFLAERVAVRELGFDQRFERLWDFYLVYCEAAFAEGSTDVVQFTLRAPEKG